MQSGAQLDFYDDQKAVTFKELFPSRESVPASVKTAHVLSSAEIATLPDAAFAFVGIGSDGGKMRKFACVDAGNTALSVAYLLKNAEKLDEESVKVAASKLVEACGWYDLMPPTQLQKLAGLIDAALTVGLMAPEIKHNASIAKQGINSTLGSKGLVRPMHKHAEVVGTHVMPLQEGSKPTYKPKATIRKVAESRTALQGRYPLDTYEQVKAASEYFDTYGESFPPVDRREYCVNLASRANELGISVSDVARKYASATYAPEGELAVAFDCRKSLLEKEACVLLDKLAAKRDEVDPEIFAIALAEFDKVAGLDAHYDCDVYDPYYSVFGFEKEAAFMHVDGSDYVNEHMLKELAVSHSAFFTKHFGEDFAEEFRQDPVSIFKSLPAEQKRVLSRLAADSVPGLAQS